MHDLTSSIRESAKQHSSDYATYDSSPYPDIVSLEHEETSKCCRLLGGWLIDRETAFGRTVKFTDNTSLIPCPALCLASGATA
jgi:hypothetical protein